MLWLISSANWILWHGYNTFILVIRFCLYHVLYCVHSISDIASASFWGISFQFIMIVAIKSCWKTFLQLSSRQGKTILEKTTHLFIWDWDCNWIKIFESKTRKIMKSIQMLQCNGFFLTRTEGHLGIFKNWLFWFHWNEIFILASNVFTYRSSLIKNIENTGYFTHYKNHKFL